MAYAHPHVMSLASHLQHMYIPSTRLFSQIIYIDVAVECL